MLLFHFAHCKMCVSRFWFLESKNVIKTVIVMVFAIGITSVVVAAAVTYFERGSI